MNRFNVIKGKDWSTISNVPSEVMKYVGSSIEGTNINQLGIYKGDSNLFATGFVGIKRLTDMMGEAITYFDGIAESEIILELSPRFNGIDQWDMLSEVMCDDEYEAYIAGNSDSLYKIFYDEPSIEIDTDSRGGEFVLAISFIMSCFSLCKVGLNHKMGFVEENLNGKVRGSICIDKQIKNNISKGKNSWIYCKYPIFSYDTLENKILKKALNLANSIIRTKKNNIDGIRSAIKFCENCFKSVNLVNITRSDFSSINVTGFNSKYKKPIELAKLLILHYGMNLLENERTKKRLIVPYAINMEKLFEFYVRTQVKKYINTNNIVDIRLDRYKRKGDIERLVTYIDYGNSFPLPYLMYEYIPDLLIQRKIDNEWKNIAVFDIKYQHSISNVNSTSRRHNTHQLLFYTLLLNTSKCGLIFPKEGDYDSIKRHLNIQNGDAISSDREYSQWNIATEYGNMEKTFAEIIEYVRNNI